MNTKKKQNRKQFSVNSYKNMNFKVFIWWQKLVWNDNSPSQFISIWKENQIIHFLQHIFKVITMKEKKTDWLILFPRKQKNQITWQKNWQRMVLYNGAKIISINCRRSHVYRTVWFVSHSTLWSHNELKIIVKICPYSVFFTLYLLSIYIYLPYHDWHLFVKCARLRTHLKREKNTVKT